MLVYTSPNRKYTMEITELKIVVTRGKDRVNTKTGKLIRAKRKIDIIVKRPNGEITSVFYAFNKPELSKLVKEFQPAESDFHTISYKWEPFREVAESPYIKV